MKDVFANFRNQTNTGLANKVVTYNYNNETGLVSSKQFFQSKGQVGSVEPCFNNVLANTYNYTYDSRIRLTGITDTRGLLNFGLFYNASNPMVVSGTTISTNYNGNINASRLLRNLTGVSNGSIPSFAKGFTQCYTYDAYNRLDLADNSDLAPTTGTNSAQFGDENPSYDKIGNISSLQRGLYDGTNYTYPTLGYSYPAGNNKLNAVTLNGAASRTYTYDLSGNMTLEQFGGVTGTYNYGRADLPINYVKNGVTTNYLYSNGDARIIKHNLSTNDREYYIADMAVFNALTNTLLWYVPGTSNEAKFNHHSPSNFSVNNSNSGATSYTTDPFLIALNQTSSYLYPDMEYLFNDHLGSTRMIYKLNYNCAGVFQNTSIQYMADYYSFGKIVREYINPGTIAEKYKYTGKERDTESGYDYFSARNYHSEIGRFMSVDPLAGKYPGWSSYHYSADNPINVTDPTQLGVACTYVAASPWLRHENELNDML